MKGLRSRIADIGVAAFLAAGVALVAPAASVAAASSLICHGGSIAAGTYSWLIVEGPCTVDAGNVTVLHKLVVARNAELVAAFGGSDLIVDGNLEVRHGAILVLGCEPGAFTCLNDDQNAPTMATNDKVGGSLIATGSLSVIVHHTRIRRSVNQLGGGGGVNCDPEAGLQGSPAYATYEDVLIGGNVSIVGWQSCWLGLFRAVVRGNVTFVNNVVADPDGNEIATNVIGGDLLCASNSPAPQVGDSGGIANIVGHLALLQCAGLAG